MSEIVRGLGERVARRTLDRRSFLGRAAKGTFVAIAAALTGNALSSLSYGVVGCTPLNGTYCNSINSSWCHADGGCGSGCTKNTSIHAPGNCWIEDLGHTCCDCNCGSNPVTVCTCRSDSVRPAP